MLSIWLASLCIIVQLNMCDSDLLVLICILYSILYTIMILSPIKYTNKFMFYNSTTFVFAPTQIIIQSFEGKFISILVRICNNTIKIPIKSYKI